MRGATIRGVLIAAPAAAAPVVIRDACGLGRGDAEYLVDPREVVVRVAEDGRVCQIFGLL